MNRQTLKNSSDICMWTEGVQVEPEAMQQLYNVTKLPFIFKHIAVMPDVHYGIGATIGSVIPTKGAVIPSAAGVDLGCFTGDTKIPVLDGKEYCIKTLAESGNKFCVYSCTESGKIIIRYAKALKTRENTSLLKIILDNGEAIRCTPDQLFMLRNGDYKKSEELLTGESIMPLYTKIDTGGYKRVMQPYSKKWQRVSWCIARSGLLGNIPKRLSKEFKHQVIIHHMSFLEDIGVLDNRPESLRFMFSGEHSRMHREMGFKFTAEMNADPEFQKKRKEGIRRRCEDPEKYQKMVDIGTDNIMRFMTEHREKFLECVSGNGVRGKKYLLKYNTSEKGRMKSSEVAHRKYKCKICGEEFEGGFRVASHMVKKHSTPVVCEQCGVEFKNNHALNTHKRYCKGTLINHKIVSVEIISEKEDVYCIQIEDLEDYENPHNFALSSGVFVHNCGMRAVKTSLMEKDIPVEKRAELREEIEKIVPTGRSNHGGSGDRGAWSDDNVPNRVLNIWRENFESEWNEIIKKNPGIKSKYGVNHVVHLGTLGSGNHFIEICLDLDGCVWIMLHSGSRGVGNRIGQYFIRAAKASCIGGSDSEKKVIDDEVNSYFKTQEFRNLGKTQKKIKVEELKRSVKERKDALGISLPHPDLAYLKEGTPLFDEYMQAVIWAQKYAKFNRQLMFDGVKKATENIIGKFTTSEEVSCHHNYISKETHFGEEILVTRKGAISAREGEKGIIPGSMGAKSYIVIGKGNEDSFCSASHGAGRKMSRSKAKKIFTVEDHKKATEGIECAKDVGVLDETPMAYKNIDDVMNAEKDLVEPIYQLRQIICVKGSE